MSSPSHEERSRRWAVEQVEAAAATPASYASAQGLLDPARWGESGCDDRALWASYVARGAEPYEVAVDHVGAAYRCSCPSRRVPCKHALALLLRWVRGDLTHGVAPARVTSWTGRRASVGGSPDTADRSGTTGASNEVHGPDKSGIDTHGPDMSPAGPPGTDASGAGRGANDAERDSSRDERVERMRAGLTELDRWLDDRMRTGLGDPSLARYATWDDLAARLVDARAGSLGNRIRRLAGLVGASPDWHDRVLAELGVLHLLAQAGRRMGELPAPLADGVATVIGWQVRQADVLAGVPETDHWVVVGRSDIREDRIEVRRVWLRGRCSGRWALVLSFAAYRQSLDASLEVGTVVHADLHRYPGEALRALVGRRHGEPVRPAAPPARTTVAACDEVGAMIAAAPWLDRLPTTVHAAVVRSDGRWWLTDDEGSLPLLELDRRPELGAPLLLAVSEGRPVDVTIEWTPLGVVPLTVHLPEHSIDVGPRADESFVAVP